MKTSHSQGNVCRVLVWGERVIQHILTVNIGFIKSITNGKRQVSDSYSNNSGRKYAICILNHCINPSERNLDIRKFKDVP